MNHTTSYNYPYKIVWAIDIVPGDVFAFGSLQNKPVKCLEVIGVCGHSVRMRIVRGDFSGEGSEVKFGKKQICRRMK